LGSNGLYPAIEPYATHRLKVGVLHELYIEESGNPQGIPVVFLHGGPGAGSKPGQRCTFDPAMFRIVLFDQRGAGRSTPIAELAVNTTDALISDIESIRKFLGIGRWLVTGGSWGSCLALAYGQAHPERCLGFRLHGIFLARRFESDWWFHGVRSLFPDYWDDFAGYVPEEERNDLLAAYYKRLTSDDIDTCLDAARRLRTFSARTQTFLPDEAHVQALTEPMVALAVSRLFTHYCINGAFLREGLLERIDLIRDIPAEIVQGRYDTVTPMISAWDLKKAWPEARFTVVTEANHVISDHSPALGTALREATDRLRGTLLADRRKTFM